MTIELRIFEKSCPKSNKLKTKMLSKWYNIYRRRAWYPGQRLNNFI